MVKRAMVAAVLILVGSLWLVGRAFRKTPVEIAAHELPGLPTDLDSPPSSVEAGAPDSSADAHPGGGAARSISMGRLKALFINRFVRFVEWPPEALGPQHRSFEVCTVGDGEVAEGLAQPMMNPLWNNRPLRLRRVLETDDLGTCHVLFVPESAGASLDRFLSLAQQRPILTVGDGSGFASRGVHINFVRRGRRMHFEMNMTAAERSPLRISPKLVGLAEPTSQPPQR